MLASCFLWEVSSALAAVAVISCICWLVDRSASSWPTPIHPLSSVFLSSSRFCRLLFVFYLPFFRVLLVHSSIFSVSFFVPLRIHKSSFSALAFLLAHSLFFPIASLSPFFALDDGDDDDDGEPFHLNLLLLYVGCGRQTRHSYFLYSKLIWGLCPVAHSPAAHTRTCVFKLVLLLKLLE